MYEYTDAHTHAYICTHTTTHTHTHSFCNTFVRSTPVLPQWHVKDRGHSAKSAGGRLHLKHAYTLDPQKLEWVDYAAVQE